MNFFFKDPRTQAAAWAALVYFVIMFISTWFIGSRYVDSVMSINVGALGAAIGWLLGFAVSPYDKDEGARFRNIISTVATFFSGFGLATIGQFIAKQDQNISVIMHHVNQVDQLTWFRLSAFAMSFICSFLVTYAARVYEGKPTS